MNSEDIVIILIYAAGLYLIAHTGVWLIRFLVEAVALMI